MMQDDQQTGAIPPFQFARVNPNSYHQQVGFHQEGFTTPSTNMNLSISTAVDD
ncbi:hypothetical protein ACPCXA_06745 [Lysinibacillus agricola]